LYKKVLEIFDDAKHCLKKEGIHYVNIQYLPVSRSMIQNQVEMQKHYLYSFQESAKQRCFFKTGRKRELSNEQTWRKKDSE